MTEEVKQKAPIILEKIKQSNKILMHWHPTPDPDCVGSSLGLMHALASFGKNITVISGSSTLPFWTRYIPGVDKVTSRNYTDLTTTEYDLFIILDSSTIEMVSQKSEVVFPKTMKTVVIDHHISNKGFAETNLVDGSYIATSLIIYDLLKLWNIGINKEIAACLFLGIYSDSGGFRYPPTSKDTFLAVAELTSIYPEFTDLIFKYENSSTPGMIKYQALALTNVSNYFDSKVAVSAVSFDELQKNSVSAEDTKNQDIANFLKTVVGWDIGITMIEREPGKVNTMFRTRDYEVYDLSKIALALDGGGHKAAAGALIKMPINEAKQYLLETLQRVYSQLGNP